MPTARAPREPRLPAALGRGDIVHLTRTRTGTYSVTLRPAGNRPPTPGARINLAAGAQLSREAMAAAIRSLRNGCTASVLCNDMAQALDTYAAVVEVQDGVRSMSALPAGVTR